MADNPAVGVGDMSTLAEKVYGTPPVDGGGNPPGGTSGGTPPAATGTGTEAPPAQGSGTAPQTPAEGPKEPEGGSLAGGPDKPADGSTEAPAGDPAAKEGETPPVELTLDSYKDLKVPETIKVDDQVLGKFKELALELKIPPEGAPKLLELYADQVKAQAEAVINQSQEQFVQTAQDWRKQSEALPEFQGERGERSKALLAQVVEEYGSPEARQILNDSHLGDHPALVKMILSMAEDLAEGEPTPIGNARPTDRNGNPAARRDAASILYPTTTSQ